VRERVVHDQEPSRAKRSTHVAPTIRNIPSARESSKMRIVGVRATPRKEAARVVLYHGDERRKPGARAKFAEARRILYAASSTVVTEPPIPPCSVGKPEGGVSNRWTCRSPALAARPVERTSTARKFACAAGDVEHPTRALVRCRIVCLAKVLELRLQGFQVSRPRLSPDPNARRPNEGIFDSRKTANSNLAFSTAPRAAFFLVLLRVECAEAPL